MVGPNIFISINKLCVSSNIFSLIMKKETKDNIKACSVGVSFTTLISWVLVGCTWTVYHPPMKLRLPQEPQAIKADTSHLDYRYYVIGEHSEIPDAYFMTKDEAEEYKTYFKENHNYKIVSIK